MNQEQIKLLIDSLAASDLAELRFSENGSTLRLVKKATPVEDGSPSTAEPVAPSAAADASTLCVAPLYGVVHLQPTPGEPAYVRVGQGITAGQTLCVIEAMKVFNEVRADADGTIEAVMVASGDEVEGGQALFRIRRGQPDV
ncbi:acetyl-CoA carboxylase biotin carboxyl carrier protein [Variovorax ginsengisoli]|uniref:Biotin carboxyl carrier protein of acetyl-CoA carboxylase n=1 Tax=Variovorax ginsengisoli TaxID=363844 RepID=A0ABT8S389_9BURK|nr:acetyl-CoA carboxylase biotin carboxyl carrier protein subunit [Variovorax ginsengisoli]MDN8613542.1 acetyl-CoA carboxylase biotin carboxyl carrier protein subunit [Variovorax ginsengisoli]MDO1532712.1 acetyl-CoA carboxylase biotin carboxyl carrier protein subunit [Variovorax ginsengisoli]